MRSKFILFFLFRSAYNLILDTGLLRSKKKKNFKVIRWPIESTNDTAERCLTSTRENQKAKYRIYDFTLLYTGSINEEGN